MLLSEELQFPQDPNEPDFTTVEQLADSIMSFVHGFDAFDEDDDGSFTDVRAFVLGDIFHSNPIAIGPPLNSLRFEPGYGPVSDINSFMGTYGHRDRVLYVGANDGMLHAASGRQLRRPEPDRFRATSSTRRATAGRSSATCRASCCPSSSSCRSSTPASSTTSTASRPPRTCGSTTTATALKEGSDWTTVLLTPLREGGESMIALDVTDPGAISRQSRALPAPHVGVHARKPGPDLVASRSSRA